MPDDPAGLRPWGNLRTSRIFKPSARSIGPVGGIDRSFVVGDPCVFNRRVNEEITGWKRRNRIKRLARLNTSSLIAVR